MTHLRIDLSIVGKKVDNEEIKMKQKNEKR